MKHKYYHNYEFAYDNEVETTASDSLYRLVTFSEKFWPKGEIKFLEAGGGVGDLAIKFQNKVMTAVVSDISLSAIEHGTQKYNDLVFIQQDICLAPLDKKFSTIVDGHLLHCLTTSEDRKNYLSHIQEMLLPNGVFILESLVSSEQMSFAPPYYFLSPVLYKTASTHHVAVEVINGKKMLPIRYISTYLEIESEILNAGLKIEFLSLPFGLKGLVDQNAFSDNAPDIIQIIAKRP